MSSGQLRRVLGWEEVTQLVEVIVKQFPEQRYDMLLVITRGGMVPACLISERLQLRNIVVAAVQFRASSGAELEEPVYWQFPDQAILANKSVLVIDDVWDSGKTAVSVRRRVGHDAKRVAVAVLHYKPGSSAYPNEEPDYYAERTDDWVIYPWDADDSVKP